MEKSDVQEHINEKTPAEPEHTEFYREVKIGKVLYRITSVYLGKFDLKTALEDLTVRKVIRDIEAQKKSAEAE